MKAENTLKSSTKKKTAYLSRLCMTVFTILLILLFFFIMSLVSKIQGTARVVNYAGLIRGMTQRIIKLEITGSPQDGMIADIDAFINGLEKGNSELNLVRLDDADFQAKMQELDAYFSQLKMEIAKVRTQDYRQTDIINKSERFFNICDEATGLAEVYSQKKAGCVWSHSEYRMEYTGPAPVPAGRLALQRVDADGAEPYRLFLENDMGEADVDNYVAASVENPERAAYLAMLDGAPVGMFHINLGEHPGRAFLYGVGISPGRRGQGLGQELMLLALAEARAMRDGVVLDVDSGNAPAYHIYQKLGFCVTFQVDYFRAPVRAG